MTITALEPTPRPLRGELASIATMLAVRFPDLSHEDIDDAVRTTYDRLDSTARIRGHLFPLTAHSARALLDRLATSMRTTKGRSSPPKPIAPSHT